MGRTSTGLQAPVCIRCRERFRRFLNFEVIRQARPTWQVLEEMAADAVRYRRLLYEVVLGGDDAKVDAALREYEARWPEKQMPWNKRFAARKKSR